MYVLVHCTCYTCQMNLSKLTFSNKKLSERQTAIRVLVLHYWNEILYILLTSLHFLFVIAFYVSCSQGGSLFLPPMPTLLWQHGLSHRLPGFPGMVACFAQVALNESLPVFAGPVFFVLWAESPLHHQVDCYGNWTFLKINSLDWFGGQLPLMCVFDTVCGNTLLIVCIHKTL